MTAALGPRSWRNPHDRRPQPQLVSQFVLDAIGPERVTARCAEMGCSWQEVLIDPRGDERRAKPGDFRVGPDLPTPYEHVPTGGWQALCRNSPEEPLHVGEQQIPILCTLPAGHSGHVDHETILSGQHLIWRTGDHYPELL